MSRTTHPVEHEEVMAYLDGELAPARAAEIAAHLDACADCATLVAEFRAVSGRLRSWQVELAPAGLSTIGLAGAESPAPPPQPKRKLLSLRWALALGGGLAIVLFLVLAVLVPNLLRFRMAAHQATPDSKRRIAEMERLMSAPPRAEVIDKNDRAREEDVLFTGPMVVHTARLAVVVKQFAGAQPAVEHIAREHQGFLAHLAVAAPEGQPRSLQATLRIPAQNLEGALAALRVLGRVEQEARSGEDVTERHVDLVARLKNARATEQRLLEVLRTRTGKISEVIEAESEVARVREEIERMEAQRRSLEDRVSFATIELRISEEYQARLDMAPPSAATRARNAAIEGWRSLTEGLLGLGLFLLRYGPTLLLWAALLFFPARWVWRRLGRASVFDRSTASERA